MDISSGDFFYHSEYGVGQVIRISEGTALETEIQFKGRPPLLLTEYLLSRTSIRISPLGFRALSFVEPETANQMIAENPVEVIRLVLMDLPSYKAKTEDIKEYLAPYIKDWDFWWDKTQPMLKEDPRIDTTNSRLREYALAREVRSQAEEAYLSFRFAKQRSVQPGELADRARAALILHQKGEALPTEHATELLDFLKQIVYFEKYDLSLRLTILFRLQEEKWISSDETHEWLVKLLEHNIRLYLLDAYTSRRVIDEFLKFPLGDREIGILASGMCTTNETIARYLLAWVFHKGDAKIIARFLITALTENLPPALEEEKYPALKNRLDSCLALVKSLPESYPLWSEVFVAFKQFNTALSSVPKLDQIHILLPALINLGVELTKHTNSIHRENVPTIIECLASPIYPIDYILAILDIATKSGKAKDLAGEIETYLFENADLRRDNFLVPFITSKWVNHLDQASQLMRIIQHHESTYLLRQGGDLICDFARQADERELVEFLPYLDQLRLLQGEWPWRTALESLREKGYLAMFRESKIGKGYRDEALVNAAQQLSDLQAKIIRQEMAEQQLRLGNLQEQVKKFQALVEEKDAVLRELRGNVGGDTEEARFEERSRILKDFVNSIAEFERFVASQPGQSREIEAVIKRFSSILSSYKVMTTESIGTHVDFNPQKHRMVETRDVAPGEKVIILERGYLIRDHKEKLRLLKPALVKKL